VRPFTFLDVGGGNGLWADRLLEAFPAAHAVVLEPSDLLLQRNVAHRRKRLVRGTAATLPDERFDLICVHWLLHHLVGNSYRATVRAQIETLRRLGQHLTSTGRIGVFENMYTGSLWHDMPGRLIYAATSLRSLAPLTRRLGANTAGVGVAFHSRRAWEAIIAAAELQIDAYAEPDPRAWPLRRAWRVGLTLRSIRVGHFWLRA
jgi:SAM-dependent methyltransferase